MKNVPHRIVIYAKDIMILTGRQERTARRLMAQIRKKYNKEEGSFVTVEEFCAYTGLKKEQVVPFLY